MDPELAAFLESRTADFEESVAWRGGAHRLHLRGYLTRDEPPDAFLIAGRALVIDEEHVLVVRDPEGEHLLPGGRREPGESALEAAQREVIEETGWSITNPRAFCVLHLHFLTARPAAAVGRMLYPDFLWQVFLAAPGTFTEGARHTDDYELGAEFRPIAEVLTQPIPAFHRALLETAVREQAKRSASCG
jgi:8-oxo-dGTP pyrophosphatase MutT (NUDIX family)